MSFSYDASAKNSICTNCICGLAKHGIFINSIDELKKWMSSVDVNIGRGILEDIGFSECFYGNEIDDIFRSRFHIKNENCQAIQGENYDFSH
jgi:hypothetical protein